LVLAFHHAGEEDANVERGGKGDSFLVNNAAHTCVGNATSNVHTNIWEGDSTCHVQQA
jgi:hypothetical protein